MYSDLNIPGEQLFMASNISPIMFPFLHHMNQDTISVYQGGMNHGSTQKMPWVLPIFAILSQHKTSFHPDFIRPNHPKKKLNPPNSSQRVSFKFYLVGGFNLHLWKMMEWKSVGMMEIPNWMEKSNSCSKPPTRLIIWYLKLLTNYNWFSANHQPVVLGFISISHGL